MEANKRKEEEKEYEEAEKGIGGERGNFFTDLTLVPTFEEYSENIKFLPADEAEKCFIHIYNAYEQFGHFGFTNLWLDDKLTVS